MSGKLQVGIIVTGFLVFAVGSGSPVVLAQVCGDEGANEQKIISSDGEDNDELGYNIDLGVDLNGDGPVALLAQASDDDNGENTGAVFVYHFDGNEWVEDAKLTPSDSGDLDYFGALVAISGDAALIGAPEPPQGGPGTGKAYIFRFDGTEWFEEAALLASDGGNGDTYGHALDIQGDVAVVGSRKHDHLGNNAGAAYVYKFDGTEWNEEVELLASDGDAGDWFGYSIAVSPGLIFVGAHKDENGGPDETGSVYVYRRDGTEWVEEAKLVPSDGQDGDEFGGDIASSGDVVVVGADQAEGLAPVSGTAYVYRFDGSTWIEEAKLMASDGGTEGFYGDSVAINGDVIVIGAYGISHDSGAAYVYRYDGTDWIEEIKLTASDFANDDWFGMSVAVRSNTVMVSAQFDDNENGINAGAVYVYTLCPDEEIPCEGDANGDGLVDPLDSGFVLARFGCDVGTGDPNCDSADMNGDGLVDPLDSGFVLARFGECP